jgi:hypothetical protein
MPSPVPTSPPLVHATPPSVEMDLDNDHDEDVLLRFHRIDNMLGPVDVPRLANRELKVVLYVVSAKELASLAEPTGDPHWCKAMGE